MPEQEAPAVVMTAGAFLFLYAVSLSNLFWLISDKLNKIVSAEGGFLISTIRICDV